MSEDLRKGVVKWFNNDKGFGFIESEDGEDYISDIFVHYTAIEQDGYKTLEGGQEVKFSLIETDKGLQAKTVQAEPFKRPAGGIS